MCGCTDYLDLGAQPLRRSPQCVPVLLGLLQWVGFVELGCGLHVGAAFQHILHDSSCFNLSRVMLELVGKVVGEFGLTLHHLTKQSR
ncbi:hypothetical protein Mapa_002235 [Marchantia paleacea]|nr:hypothetical protein Mapa_002235 [Marchantia paleacea]